MRRGQVDKPEWWSDEGLKALSARVVRAAPNEVATNTMRAEVLSGMFSSSEAGLRSPAELKEAAVYFERAVSGLRRCALRRRRRPCSQETPKGAAARQRPCRRQCSILYKSL